MIHYVPMSDDALIAGAAAPVGHRWIRSTAVLDAGWVLVSSFALIASSFFALIDLPNAQLRTGAEPLRFFVLGLPAVAAVIAVIGAVRGSVVVVAAATGMIAPSVALAGSLAISLLLSDQSAFADGGVAISLGAALVGVAMLVRWFVYHPQPLLGDQTRPALRLGHALVALGGLLAGILLVTTVAGDTSWSAASVGQTLLLLTVACVVAAAGGTRTIAAAWLASAACASQVIAVLAVKAEQSTIPFDSDLVLRTGVAGFVALIVAVAVSAIAAMSATIDPEPDPDAAADTTESWRWHSDE
nr:hypothetical protein [uncultured bacterium]